MSDAERRLSKEREAEIRDLAPINAPAWQELLSELDATRDELREARERLARQVATIAELRAEMETDADGSQAAQSVVDAQAGERAALDRAEAAEAQLAALREAVVVLPYQSAVGAYCLLCSAATYTMGAEPFHGETCPVRASTATAEAYKRRVQAEALREAAARLEQPTAGGPYGYPASSRASASQARHRLAHARWLRAEAERIEGGGR